MDSIKKFGNGILRVENSVVGIMDIDPRHEEVRRVLDPFRTLEDNDVVDRVQTVTVKALATLDAIGPIVHDDEPNVSAIWQDTRDEVLDCAVAVITRREKMLYVMMRGVMEGMFTSLFYREQGISRTLWARGQSFVMTHQLFEDKHDFYQYFKPLFEDERYKMKYGGIGARKIFAEASKLYSDLSSYVHKKRIRPPLGGSGRRLVDDFEDILQRVFRIALTFLDAVEDLPEGLDFPVPLTWPEYVKSKGVNRHA